MKTRTWYAHGKLLLTGEYLVLEGAKALAVPLKLGQYLSITQQKEPLLFWNAMKPDGFWFQAVCRLPDLTVIQSTNEELCKKLQDILFKVRELNPDFLTGETGYSVETILEFDPSYGFGSSSTLIANLAKWAEIDPFELQRIALGGSGYDIACATLKSPIIYQLVDGRPHVEHVSINYDFTNCIYFVYLGFKQSSADSIKSFRKSSKITSGDIDQMNMITEYILRCKNIREFEKLVNEHERFLASILNRKKVKSLYFKDFEGSVKSLGGWGGDFVMMTTLMPRKNFEAYLGQKGYKTYYSYDELVM